LSVDSIDTHLLIIVKKLRIRRRDLRRVAHDYARHGENGSAKS
jgi:hypothetical protein